MRIAAADRLIERPDEIAAYRGAQFNTVVLYDTEDIGGLLKSERRIAFEVAFARTHRLHILVGKATEPLPLQVTQKNAMLRLRHAAVKATEQVSDAEIRERLSLWDRYGHDLILGVFFYTTTPASSK